MISNLEKYKKDLDKLISDGNSLHIALQKECHPEQFEKIYKDFFKKGDKKATYEDFIKDLPNFSNKYQNWYSESLVLIKQLIPNRINDFTKLYEKPKTTRKEITHDNYTIEDCLFGLRVTRGWEKIKVVGPEAAIPRFEQQLNILISVKGRFESSLFDIKQLVQADLFDSEIEAAKELLKNKFIRAAGAVGGVVLEKHLSQVCEGHNIALTKKDPSIGDLNNVLKEKNVIDVSQWRFVQHLGDLRNICDHGKKKEPTDDQVKDLLEGIEKIIKTVF